MRRLNNFRKVVVWILLLVTVFQVFFSSFYSITVNAEGANDRLSNYLNLAKGKTINDIDVSKLTQEELQMIGVYLSNFYIPMSTELVTSRDDSTAKENMVSALVEGASFDEDMANALVEAIWDMTVQSATPLYIGKITDNGVEDVSFSSTERDEVPLGYGSVTSPTAGMEENGHTVATYFSFLDWWTGLSIVDTDDFDMVVQPILKGLRICLFWEDASGNKIPVFDTEYGDADGDKDKPNRYGHFTASSLTYAVINDNLNYKNGVGSALIDCTLDEFNALTPEQQQKVIATDARLFVDCFGNILVDYGVAKYVLVPACANPYAWYTNQDPSTAGKSINLVNLFMLDEISSGHVEINNTCECDNNACGHSYKFGIYTGSNSLMNNAFWRLQRGSGTVSLDANQKIFKGAFNLGDAETLYDRVTLFCDEATNQRQRFPHWAVYYASLEKNVNNYRLTKKEWHKNIIDDFIVIDSLGAFKSSSSEDDYKLFNLLNDGKGGFPSSISGTASANFSGNLNSNELNIVQTGDAKKYLTGIYISYALAFYNDMDENGNPRVNYTYNKAQFPSVSGIEIDWANIEVSTESIDSEIKSMIYYILHPTEGTAYFSTWFKSKIGGILVSWHEDMVGSSSGSSTTGATRYIGFTGYTTLPALNEIEWTSWLLEEYNNIVVYLIIIIFIILIAYCIIGSMTFQRAIIGTLLFGILAFFPPLCINATVNVINTACDRIYGDKFTYWALVQHETYKYQLDESAKTDDKDNYLSTLFSFSAEQQNPNNYTRIRLKWLSPKKIDVVADVESDINDFTSSALLSNFMRGTMQQQLSGETFLDAENALYLYRDYADIYNYMSSAYFSEVFTPTFSSTKLYMYSDSSYPLNYNSVDTDGNSVSMDSILDKRNDEDKEFSLAFAQKSGFITDTGTNATDNKSFSFLLGSNVCSRVMYYNKSLVDGSIQDGVSLDISTKFNGQSFGLGTDNFSVTLPMMNQGITHYDIGNFGGNYDVWVADKDRVYNEADAGAFYYALYTESPFYFFAWNIYDQQNSDEFSASIGNTSENFNSRLLDMYTINHQSYFYNYSDNALNGYGEMRDFCNMRSLFYYVIPYLKECNAGIESWSDLYGTFLYEDVRVEYSEGKATNFPTADDSDEYIYKWWHNYNVERLFNTYSPWVDLIYSCDYAESETISVLGEKYLVVDPLDPTSYYRVNAQGDIVEGRMMVFSRSEMKYYGLEMSDLTQVEQKIIKVQDKVYEDLLILMDYASFDNDVLVTSAGMLTTFAFNQEFSQINPFGESYTLYPQNYELKAFTYDAYLRLILAESTGESLMDTTNSSGNTFIDTSGSGAENKSYYQRIVENSSITTGIAMIILDIFAVYAIPALKLFFLVAIFFMSILMIVSAAIKLEMNIVQTTWESLVAPLLKFLAVSIGMAWIVSLFMSDGNTTLTGRDNLTISLGDPTMVILVMIVINIAVLVLYYKICKQCFTKLVEFAKAIGTSIGGAVAGSIGKIAGITFAGKTISDSIARGTAKARGVSNQPTASPSVGTGGVGGDSNSSGGTGENGGNSNHNAGAFLGGALAGKALDDVSDAHREKVEQRKQHFNDKASQFTTGAKDIADKVKDGADSLLDDRRVEMSSAKDTARGRISKSRHERDESNIKGQRETLKTIGENSGVLGKTSVFVQDKKLAVQQMYHSVAKDTTVGYHNAKSNVRKSASTVMKFGKDKVDSAKGHVSSTVTSARNSKAGRTLHLDDTSRRNRLSARQRLDEQRSDAERARARRKSTKKGK